MKQLTPVQKIHLLYVAERHRRRLQEVEKRGGDIFRAYRRFLKQDNFRGQVSFSALKHALQKAEVI
jgi:hypothetical protein